LLWANKKEARRPEDRYTRPADRQASFIFIGDESAPSPEDC